MGGTAERTILFGRLFFSFLFFFSLDPGHGAQTIGWLGLRGALAIGLGSSVVRTLEGKRRKVGCVIRLSLSSSHYPPVYAC